MARLIQIPGYCWNTLCRKDSPITTASGRPDDKVTCPHCGFRTLSWLPRTDDMTPDERTAAIIAAIAP